MSIRDYFSQRARGVGLIGEAQGLSKADLVAMGAEPDEADQMLELYRIYFGETTFAGFQRTARESAHGLAALQRIERHVRRVRGERKAWRLRAELCHVAPGDLDRIARARLAELNPPRKEEDGVKIRRGKGKWKLVITGDSKDIADVFEHQDGSLETFLDGYFAAGTQRPEVTTNVIVTLDELDQITRGEGDELVLKLTNGATMTGAEYLSARLSAHGFAAIFHPVEGPVDLMRSERFANGKQRHLCSLENPTCAWPGCNCPATESQVHHITAFKDGGLTNVRNLVMLCPYHNGINADDPEGPNPRGRMDRVLGATAWIPPYPGAPVLTGIYAKGVTAA